MEFLSIVLSILLLLISPIGLIVDRTAKNAIRSQFAKVQQLQVRVDHLPPHQLLQGKVKHVRVAGRELQLKQHDLRISALELETDAIDVDLRSIGRKKLKLRRPIQAGVRLVLNQQDITQALNSQQVTAKLLNLGRTNLDKQKKYNIVKPKIELLTNNRVRFRGELTQSNLKPLAITVELGLKVVSGRQLQIIAPVVLADGEEVPKQIVNAIATNFTQRLDLGSLDSYGLQARILQLKITPKKLEIAAFVSVEPSSRLWEIAFASM